MSHAEFPVDMKGDSINDRIWDLAASLKPFAATDHRHMTSGVTKY
jgi:hypothetical protein